MTSLLERASKAWTAAQRRWHIARPYRLYENFMPDRIGHLCLETDTLLKAFILDGKPTRGLILRDIKERFANQHIVEYFRRYLTVTTSHPLLTFLDHHGPAPELTISTASMSVAMYETAGAYDVYARWGRRAPLFSLTPEDQAALRRYLSTQGIGKDDWYVCLHARGGGYSTYDEQYHSYRNVEIATFNLAVEEIAGRGGWCIRLGDPTMSPAPHHPRLIDYALSAEKSAQLDVALSAGCRFFLGCASGLVLIAQIFGRPSAVVNMAPLSGCYSLGVDDLSIPQLLHDESGRRLGLEEIMNSEKANYRLTEEFTRVGLTNIGNTPEEIRDLAAEMLDRLEGRFTELPEDDSRQAKFRALFRLGHYSFGSVARIGRDFLRQHL